VGLAITCLACILKLVENRALLLQPLPHPPPGPCRAARVPFYGGSQKFRSGGALGGPGEACVKFGGEKSMLGAYAPTRGALPRRSTFYTRTMLTRFLAISTRRKFCFPHGC